MKMKMKMKPMIAWSAILGMLFAVLVCVLHQAFFPKSKESDNTKDRVNHRHPTGRAEMSATHRGSLTGPYLEIPNTRSRDGQYALFAINVQGTTAAVVGIAPTAGSKRCLAVTSVLPYGSGVEDRKDKSYLTVLWSPSSTRVAIHDSARKHSLLELYALHNGDARKVELPDLLRFVMAEGVLVQMPVSSGQEPLEWKDDHHLYVEFRAKTSAGSRVARRLALSMVPDPVTVSFAYDGQPAD